ncbi:uncharacterized protein PV09_09150 [Verruconis gallopava]|uniref:Zn(2)-C6 fungal-type domain-containing protein n=1 Tax=Verruconis gallopava TaxID=253628 RepID=A0A0D1ZYN3_9PEZI|nr:uncharacterized protein PV09_09150 [Verruconis gallopava]KIV99199.1 hypothetical protein PV09_09150 [Verruconis gallopava]
MESPRQQSSPESDHHQDGQQNTRKRKRKTFSCDACRKRKLKCTRELPVCSRCQKSGNAANCVYENPPEPTKPSEFIQSASLIGESNYRLSLFRSPNMFDTSEARSHYRSQSHADDRLTALENRVASMDPHVSEDLTKHQRLDVDVTIEPSLASQRRESIGISLYGSGFKTGYFGPSSERNVASYHPAIIKLYPQLKVFFSFHNLQNPLFAQLRTHIRGIRKNSKLAKKILPYPSVATLFDAVPDKDVCTKMVSLYWETIASTYHIFHGPTFWSAFWLYWGDPQQRTEAFACTILLMLSCVNSIERRKPARYRGLSSVPREQSSYWIEICESWMRRQSRKHLRIDSFQNRVLLVISKQINAIKTKQAWERANELLTFAISTGLHQDPTKIDSTLIRDQTIGVPSKPKTTPYEQEMRKRLWAAIVELEMQASLDKGIPSSRLALLADCGKPSLLDDEQFEVCSSLLPLPEPRSKFIGISYLNLSQESLRLRATLSDIINTGSDHLSYDEILMYDDKIKRALNDLPDWVKIKNSNASSSLSQLAATPAALLELQLLQFQLWLHAPSARQAIDDSRANLSRITCIDCAVRIMSLHARLAKSSPPSHRIHWLTLAREDVFRAIMAICYNLTLWRGLSSDYSSVWLRDIYTEHALLGLGLFKEKVYALGEHFLQLWHSFAAVGTLRAAFEPSSVNIQVSTIAEELTTIFESLCSSQEEPSNEQTAAGALTAMATPNSGGYDVTSGSTPAQVPDLAASQAFLDRVDVSNWGTFDDVWPFGSSGLSW